MHARGARERTRDNSRAKLNRSLASVPGREIYVSAQPCHRDRTAQDE